MKRSTTRTLSHLGAVLLIALAIWVGSYFCFTRGMMAEVMVSHPAGRERLVDVKIPWIDSVAEDPFSEPSNVGKALISFYKPLTLLEAKFTGRTVFYLLRVFHNE